MQNPHTGGPAATARLSHSSFGERAGYVVRALACLRPYAVLVVGAYAAVLVSSGTAVWMPMVIRNVVDDGIRGGSFPAVLSGCLLLLALAVVQGVATFLTGRWSETASQNVAFDLRNRFHEKLQSLSFSFHDRAEAGQLLARSVGDVDRIRFLTGRAFLHLVQMGSLALGIAVAMLIVEPRLALLALVVVPFFILGGGGSGFRAEAPLGTHPQPGGRADLVPGAEPARGSHRQGLRS